MFVAASHSWNVAQVQEILRRPLLFCGLADQLKTTDHKKQPSSPTHHLTDKSLLVLQ
jgi:hypothetical protein